MATTTKVIVQIHERVTEFQIDADLQLREVGFISGANLLRFNENDGTKHNIWMQDSSTVTFDNSMTIGNQLIVTNAFTVGTSGLYASSGGSVGINTTNPNSELHINATDTVARMNLTNTSTGTTSSDGSYIEQSSITLHLNNQENGHINLSTNDTQRMTILNTGNVGIGTTGPDSDLEISGIDPTLKLTDTGDTTELLLQVDDSKGYIGTVTDSTFELQSNSVTMMSLKHDDARVNIFSGFDLRLVSGDLLVVDGDVGIGTASPNAALDVAGATILEGLTVNSASTFNASITLGTFDDLIGSASSDVNLNSGAILLEGSTGKIVGSSLGIGTASPGRLLELGGSNTDNDHGMRIEQDGTGDAMYAVIADGQGYSWGIDNSDANKWKLSSDSTAVSTNTLMSILPTGNKEMEFNIGFTKFYSIEVGKEDHRITVLTTDADAMAIYSYDEGLAVSTPIKLGSSASNTGILVDANGKVGIQKSVPTEDLDVAGTVAISSTLDVSGDIALAADTIEFKLGASGDAQQWWSGTDFHINVNSGEIRLGGGKTTVVASTTASLFNYGTWYCTYVTCKW
jgi:hypothetical protein